MTTPPTARLQAWFEKLAAAHDVVGASVAIAHGDEVETAATGIVSVVSRLPVSPNTVIQIGSISKTYTAVLVLQLVDEGLVALDEGVRTYVPEFRPDTAADEPITVRQLLNHTSGLSGDFFPETGRGDDAVEKFVGMCGQLDALSAPGELYSYSNAGYTLLGRLVQNVLGVTWEQALHDRIVTPLGLTATVALLEDVLMHPAAIGHMPGEGGEMAHPKRWTLPRSAGPGGGIVATARDVALWGRRWTTLLAPPTATLVRRAAVPIPSSFEGDACGLGWWRLGYEGAEVIGHTGGNMGQGGCLIAVPENDFAVAVLCNGLKSMPFYDEVLHTVLADRLGVKPVVPDLSAVPLADPAPYVGRYGNDQETLEMFADPVGLRCVATHLGFGIVAPKTTTSTLTHLGKDRFRCGDGTDEKRYVFAGVGADGARYLHSSFGRVLRRVG